MTAARRSIATSPRQHARRMRWEADWRGGRTRKHHHRAGRIRCQSRGRRRQDSGRGPVRLGVDDGGGRAFLGRHRQPGLLAHREPPKRPATGCRTAAGLRARGLRLVLVGRGRALRRRRVVVGWHGVTELLHGEAKAEDYLVAYVVLAVAFVLESISLSQALRQLRGEARSFDRDVLSHILDTSDPTTRAVFAEDTAALIGIILALLGIGLHQLTGNAAWDAVGSILVGLLLGVIAVVLIDRNRRFLVGEPASPALQAAVVDRIRQLPEVAAVRFLRLVFVGPKQLFLVASVDLAGDQVESRIAPTLRRLEEQLQADPYIVDAVLTIAEPDDLDRRA